MKTAKSISIKLGKLIDWQIEQGTDAIVAVGTTGEASTLTDEEHRAVIKYAVEHTAGRVPVIAGTGANDTDYEVSLSRYACEVGADALLLVSRPTYNKTTQKGLISTSLLPPTRPANLLSSTMSLPARARASLRNLQGPVKARAHRGNQRSIEQHRPDMADNRAVRRGSCRLQRQRRPDPRPSCRWAGAARVIRSWQI